MSSEKGEGISSSGKMYLPVRQGAGQEEGGLGLAERRACLFGESIGRSIEVGIRETGGGEGGKQTGLQQVAGKLAQRM